MPPPTARCRCGRRKPAAPRSGARAGRGCSPAGFANEQYERARAAAARLINADAADVALISSVGYGVATAAKVLTIPRGSRVLVLEDDHSSPVLEWQTRAEAQGFAVETVRQPERRRLDLGGARRDRASRRAAGRLASISSVHWSDGGLIDLDKVGAALRRQGARS